LRPLTVACKCGEPVVTAGVHLLHGGQKVKTIGAGQVVAKAR
jgi:hypothetical protein